jgi:hypothetical protein
MNGFAQTEKGEPMNDLISREAARSTLNDEITITGKSNAIAVTDYVRRVERRLEQLPAADAVPVIRCKDCKHWYTTWQNDFAPNYHYCPFTDGTHRDDFYCADAEMRGEQDDSV